MSPANTIVIARKEIRDAVRNRWFLFYAAAFTVLALALSYLSIVGTGMYGLAGFGRTTAGLVNLVLLIVPLMALTIGAGSLAGEKERGTLGYLLSQPVSRVEVLIGKYLGLAVSLAAALALGFGISALVIAIQGGAGGAGSFGVLVGLTAVLSLAMLSVGFLLSTVARRASVAVGAAIVVWLGLAFLSDLGLMGSAIAFKLSVTDLFRLALLNPLQVFKMSVLGSVHASLDVLGPAGVFATQTYGRALGLLFGGSLAAWIVLPLAASTFLFSRRGIE
jgi:Cu-processing system permease protein